MNLDIRPFQIQTNAWGVLCCESRRVTGLYAPVFCDQFQSQLFASWLTDWQSACDHAPSEDQQYKVADAIIAWCQPVLGIPVEDLYCTASGAYRDFLASASGRELHEVAA